jgi:hypothetical protein
MAIFKMAGVAILESQVHAIKMGNYRPTSMKFGTQTKAAFRQPYVRQSAVPHGNAVIEHMYFNRCIDTADGAVERKDAPT